MLPSAPCGAGKIPDARDNDRMIHEMNKIRLPDRQNGDCIYYSVLNNKLVLTTNYKTDSQQMTVNSTAWSAAGAKNWNNQSRLQKEGKF